MTPKVFGLALAALLVVTVAIVWRASGQSAEAAVDRAIDAARIGHPGQYATSDAYLAALEDDVLSRITTDCAWLVSDLPPEVGESIPPGREGAELLARLAHGVTGRLSLARSAAHERGGADRVTLSFDVTLTAWGEFGEVIEERPVLVTMQRSGSVWRFARVEIGPHPDHEPEARP